MINKSYESPRHVSVYIPLVFHLSHVLKFYFQMSHMYFCDEKPGFGSKEIGKIILREYFNL
jgi:hypothetical protein